MQGTLFACRRALPGVATARSVTEYTANRYALLSVFFGALPCLAARP